MTRALRTVRFVLWASAVFLLSCRERDAPGMIVLAVDGMDPNLLAQYIREGRTPNLERLASAHGLVRLGTSTPPQSPVAWSHFLTGHDSHVHGIYDFVHRDPVHMTPYLSTAKAEGPAYTMELGGLVFPVGGGVDLLRRGHPFWSALAHRGFPTSVVKIPANYPPVEPSRARVLAGMGTPDLMGTPGMFQVFTADEQLLNKRQVSGGRLHLLRIVTPTEGKAYLDGPPDPFSPTGEPMKLPVEVHFGPKADSALIRLGDSEVLLGAGEWSPWVPVAFEPSVDITAIQGVVRIYAKSLGERPTIYVSPINLDPLDPAQPLSSPETFAREIAEDVGRYYTQGMPEDTKALVGGVLSDEDFLRQEEIVFQERRAMLARELERFDRGFLFFYFSSVDLVSHMFWRSIEPDASEADRLFAHVIPDLYTKMDDVVGEILSTAPGGTTLVVMSDHGFGPYHTKVHLNAWLMREGFLALKPEQARVETVLGHIDWSRTRAYALGLNQVFLNLRGREPEGIVRPEEAPWVLETLARELETFIDPDTGAQVVTRTFRPEVRVFSDRVPDLIIGYARGYRSSDESALGQVGSRVLEPNRDKWSGDHCVDPVHVPGVLLSNRKLRAGDWSLTDFAPTVQAFFGLANDDDRKVFLARDPE